MYMNKNISVNSSESFSDQNISKSDSINKFSDNVINSKNNYNNSSIETNRSKNAETDVL